MAGTALHPWSYTKTLAIQPFSLRFLRNDHASRLQDTQKVSLLCFLQWHLLLDALEGVGVFLNQILAPFLKLLFSCLHVSLLTFDDLQVVLVLCQFSSRHSWMLCSRSTCEGPPHVDSTYLSTAVLRSVGTLCFCRTKVMLRQNFDDLNPNSKSLKSSKMFRHNLMAWKKAEYIL